jgi:glycosyltransferase involved in cell wall biosynthesis
MKKKILFVGGTQGGGVAMVNNEVIRIFENSGYSYDLVDPPALKARFPNLIAHLFSYIITMVKIITFRPDTVYVQLAQTRYIHQTFHLLIAKLFRRETIGHLHAKADLKNVITRAQLGRMIFSQNYIDKMIVLTEPCRQSLLNNGWKKSVFVVPNFISTENLPADFRPVTERSQLLYLGRMSWEKGIFEILEIAERLPDEDFVFVGNFEDKQTEKEFTQKLGALDNARYLGSMYNEEKFKIIAESRLLILPTRRDEFPMILIESSMLGCVPLVAPTGSVGEIIKDGYNGFYISPDDVEGIIEKIRYLKDSDDLQRVSDNGIEFARKNFTSRNAEKKLFEIVG